MFFDSEEDKLWKKIDKATSAKAIKKNKDQISNDLRGYLYHKVGLSPHDTVSREFAKKYLVHYLNRLVGLLQDGNISQYSFRRALVDQVQGALGYVFNKDDRLAIEEVLSRSAVLFEDQVETLRIHESRLYNASFIHEIDTDNITHNALATIKDTDSPHDKADLIKSVLCQRVNYGFRKLSDQLFDDFKRIIDTIDFCENSFWIARSFYYIEREAPAVYDYIKTKIQAAVNGLSLTFEKCAEDEKLKEKVISISQEILQSDSVYSGLKFTNIELTDTAIEIDDNAAMILAKAAHFSMGSDSFYVLRHNQVPCGGIYGSAAGDFVLTDNVEQCLTELYGEQGKSLSAQLNGAKRANKLII